MSRKLFGTDGIRGPANEYPLTAEFARRLGQAVGSLLIEQSRSSPPNRPNLKQPPSAVIGRDTRVSGPMLEDALAAGLNATGVDVTLLGVIPTPAVSFLTRELGASLGVVISASHNPYHDNGIKFFGHDGYKFDDAFEAQIESLVLDESSPLPTATNIGRVNPLENAVDRYVDFALKTVHQNPALLENFRIHLDCANGASHQTSEAILKKLGAQVVPLHTQPNGVNINESCGCTHPSIIQESILADPASKPTANPNTARPPGANEGSAPPTAASGSSVTLVGVSHDGDADRVLLCDETGAVLDGDELMAIAAVHMLENNTLADNTLVATIMSNWGLNELLESRGGKVLRTQVGDRYVLETMRENNLNLGGEQSGHFIFHDHNLTGDGIISALQFLQIMAATGQPLSELRQVLTKYPQAQRNIQVKVKPPVEELSAAQSLIAETEATLGDQGRTLLRYSGTEALIRLLIEGKDAAYIETQADAIAEAIQSQIGAD
ncbi:MAG: phosphoglucosamine mutase [Verrucomicrobiota bacterium]